MAEQQKPLADYHMKELEFSMQRHIHTHKKQTTKQTLKAKCNLVHKQTCGSQKNPHPAKKKDKKSSSLFH